MNEKNTVVSVFQVILNSMVEQKIIEKDITVRIVKRVLSSFANLINHKEDITGLRDGLKRDTVFVSSHHSRTLVNQPYVEQLAIG